MAHLKMPKLHAAQRRVGREAERFNVLDCGRRFGKTRFGVSRLAYAPKGFLRMDPRTGQGYPVGWFAPTYKYLSDPWRDVLELYRPIIASKDKTERRIHLINGGVIDFWTLDDPDAGRSRKYGHIVVDEAAKVRNLKDAWTQSIRPTLADFQGGGDFLSTPKGNNYFRELYDFGIDDPARNIVRRAGWRSFQLPTSSNPYILSTEIADARLDLPELVFAQEFLAQFVDFGGTAVKREWLQSGYVATKWRWEQLRIAIGVDLAISKKDAADFVAFVVVAIDPEGQIWVVWAERDRLTFHKTQERIKRLAELFSPQVIVLEEVAYQAAAIQELLRTTSLNVQGMTPDRDKLTRFQTLQRRYEIGLVTHSWDLPAVFEGELLAFPEGDHDDMVDALVYAYLGAAQYDLGQTVESSGDRIATGSGAIAESDANWGTVSVNPIGSY